MGYDLKPRNKDAGWFNIGAFSFPILLEACGYLWPCIHKGAKWFCVFGADPRMPEGDDYPRLLSNDGFHVTAEESRIMARVARNFVAVQHQLEPQKENFDDFLLPEALQAWPRKIHEDFTDKFEKFAAWAEKSSGFWIY